VKIGQSEGDDPKATIPAVRVLAIAPGPVIVVIIVAAAHEHSDINLVVSLVQDDPAYPAVISAEQDAKFELADVPLPEAKRAPDSPPAFRRPLLELSLVGFRIKLDDRLAVPVSRTPLPPAQRRLRRRIPRGRASSDHCPSAPG
jgi:hypothetical protein